MSVTGLRIKYRREALGYSQNELADLVHGTQKQIWRYESGNGFPSVESLVALAKVLNTSTDWLLGLTDDIKPFQGESDLTDMEREMINIMRQKSPEGQRKLVDVAKVM